MSRTITPAIITELAQGTVRPAIFFEAQFPSGALRLWSGYGDITWNSQTWTGAGTLMGIGTIEESADVVATGTTVMLSGIPSTLVSLCLTDARQGMPGKIWIGFMTEAFAVITDPILAFAGRLDVPQILDDEQRCEIQITYESRLIDLNRERDWRYTHESQQQLAPGDRGFEYVAALQDKEIRWGMGTSVAGQVSAAVKAQMGSAMTKNILSTNTLFGRAKPQSQLIAEQIEWSRNKDWSSDR